MLAIHKYTNSIFFPHFFHLFVTINSKFAITSHGVIYSSFPFKTSPAGDYSLEPEKSWRFGGGGGMGGRFVSKGQVCGREKGEGVAPPLRATLCEKMFSFFFFLFDKLWDFFSFSWSLTFSPLLAFSGLVLLSFTRPLPPLPARRPLAKRRTCWLSWTSERSKNDKREKYHSNSST